MPYLNKLVDQKIDQSSDSTGPNYSELLTVAHKKGLKSISVAVVQIPDKENGMVAICEATVILRNKTFVDIAEASPESVNDITMIHYLIRVASTRAKSRALRDALGIAFVTSSRSALQNNQQATMRQIAAIEKLSKQLGKKTDPSTLGSLSKVAASQLITQLSAKLQKIS